ncbi:MAG: LacI family DNA-binding transcriptional regulator [Galactobacter sp.]|uniref:LacI family DNA-binding transcriptional regulator n=1 Tax=Galactobacter sp. TaxID=2676125 RepID=UPI0025BAB50C|nr:LacI family DNA-binding transcriptional regulator [Galactobacter sp.]
MGAEQVGTNRAHRRRGPSIGDVARHAGVSAQTVSRVSTGAQNVRPETRERVLASMQALGYSPNIAARALRNGSYGALGLIAHQLSRTGEAKTVEAVVEASRENGYNVVLVDVETPSSTQMSAAVHRLTHQSIDGLIVIRAESSGPSTLSLPQGLPLAVADSRVQGSPGVDTDQAGGALSAVEHLLALGHPTIHHLAGPKDSGPARQREAAWRQALETRGIRVPPVLRGDWTAASGYQLGCTAIDAARRSRSGGPHAVFAANDEMAAGFMHALAEHGVRVPHDVSVVGFDGLPLAEYLWPGLTTVKQDFPRIGRELVGLVMDQMDGRSPGEERLLVPTELVVRGSTAPPHS